MRLPVPPGLPYSAFWPCRVSLSLSLPFRVVHVRVTGKIIARRFAPVNPPYLCMAAHKLRIVLKKTFFSPFFGQMCTVVRLFRRVNV